MFKTITRVYLDSKNIDREVFFKQVSMAHQQFPLVALLLASLVAVAARVHSDSKIQGPLQKSNGICAQFVLAQNLGYVCEEYMVQTDDGFLLGVQRMYRSTQGVSTPKKPVFLYHGILQSGASWLLNQPSEALPFMLGNAGYEVWIGNSRTTRYSNGHVSLQRTETGFWNWSLDELAASDLPAMLSVVASMTNNTIHYIGYSQGSQAAFAAFSEGQIMSLLDKVVLLAPAAYCNSITDTLAVGADSFLIDELMLAGVDEFDPHEKDVIDFMDNLCSIPEANCTGAGTGIRLLETVTGPNCCMNESRVSYYDGYGESTATKNIVHLAQQYRTQSFAKYDNGLLQNLQEYNSISPPSYDVSKIPSMPLLLIHGGKDGLADMKDVALLLEKLQFTPRVMLLPNYGHIDFIVGMTAARDCYQPILAFLST